MANASAFLGMVIGVAEIALATIILYFIVECIGPMPSWAKQVCQLLIVLIAILTVLRMVVTAPVDDRQSVPRIVAPPSIIR